MTTTGRGTEEKEASRGRESGGSGDADTYGREEYDLLIALALGVAAGAGLTLLLRGGSRERRPAASIVRGAGSGAARLGRSGARGARKLRRKARQRGEQLLGRIPLDEVGESLGEYISAARETIDDAVSREIKDLRKAVRRRRKRLGV